MPDSSAIDNALIAVLGADSALLALCPNGVYFAQSPPGSTRYVVVSMANADDVQMFGGRALEDGLYLIKAVMLSTAGGDIKAAAARIDALLEQQTLTVSGYGPTVVHRESRERQTEPDDVDPSILWLHRGGFYRVVTST